MRNNHYWDKIMLMGAELGRLNEIKEAFAKGADINAKDHNGKTPLHIAAVKGYVEVIKFLLQKGADINAKDHNGTVENK